MTRQAGKSMSLDQEDPVIKFFRSSDLVEKILPYLDLASILHLAESKISCTIKILQETTLEWNKLVRRTLPEEFKIEPGGMYPFEYFPILRGHFEEKRVRIHELYSIIKMMNIAKARAPMLHLLDVICQNFPPEETDLCPTFMRIQIDGA